MISVCNSKRYKYEQTAHLKTSEVRFCLYKTQQITLNSLIIKYAINL